MLRLLIALVGMTIGLAILSPLMVLALLFFIIAAATRAIRAWMEPHAAPWPEAIKYHPRLGWRPKANLDTYCTFAAGIFHLRTGEDGWPQSCTFEECDLLAIGDSYVFGYGVDAKDAFFSVCRNVKVKAVGAPGYSMVHAVAWLRRLAPKLRGKLVVWMPCYSNDLYDNLLPNLYHYRTPFARRDREGRWEICDRHVSAEPWPFNPEKNARSDEKFRAVFGENALSERAYEASRFLIQSARDICMDAGADLVVLGVPWPVQMDPNAWREKCAIHGGPDLFDASAPDKKIGAICGSLDVPFIAGRDWLAESHHIPGEGHWNKKGHRQIARLLERVHEEWLRRREIALAGHTAKWAAADLKAAAGGAR